MKPLIFFLALLADVASASLAWEPLAKPPSEIEAPSLGRRESPDHTEISQRLEFAAPELGQGAPRLRVPGARMLLVEGLPEVPMVVSSVPLPPGHTGQASLEEIRVESSTVSARGRVLDEPLLWGPPGELNFPRARYGKYFPGKWVETHDVGGRLAISVFPIQYDRQSGHWVALRSATLRIRFRPRAADSGMGPLWNTPAILVTPVALLEGAMHLQKYHWQHFGLSTEVVTVEHIDRTEEPLPESEYPEGYKTRGDADEVIIPYNPETGAGYRYVLARKIAAFLRKRMGEDSQTRYVLLLGDAQAIPPSYYFSVDQGLSRKFGVTDLCYAAREQCLSPALAVGRLPFRTNDEVAVYLGKLSRWLDQAGKTASEVAAFGGKAFPGGVYFGELGTMKVTEDAQAGWRGVRKFYRSNGRYRKASVVDLFAGNLPSAFAYYLDHGHGNEARIDADSIGSRDIEAIETAGTGVNPVLVSVACSNASIDNALLKKSVYRTPEHGESSIGVAALRSRAGVVAYLGASRPVIGSPIYDVDTSGNVSLTGTNYGLQLLDTVFESYRDREEGRLGDLVMSALKTYRFERGNDFAKNARHTWTYFSFAFLGDPAVSLPKRSRKDRVLATARSTTAFDKAPAKQLPTFSFDPMGAGRFALSLDVPTRAKASLIRLLPVGFDPEPEIVEERELAPGAMRWEFAHNGDIEQIRYLLRIENAEGAPVERQVWFHVEGKEAIPMTASTGAGTTRP